MARLRDIATSLRSAGNGTREFAAELASCIKKIQYDSIVSALLARSG